jgi:hypothetical protein
MGAPGCGEQEKHHHHAARTRAHSPAASRIEMPAAVAPIAAGSLNTLNRIGSSDTAA